MMSALKSKALVPEFILGPGRNGGFALVQRLGLGIVLVSELRTIGLDNAVDFARRAIIDTYDGFENISTSPIQVLNTDSHPEAWVIDFNPDVGEENGRLIVPK
jgi:hypothetical protein